MDEQMEVGKLERERSRQKSTEGREEDLLAGTGGVTLMTL